MFKIKYKNALFYLLIGIISLFLLVFSLPNLVEATCYKHGKDTPTELKDILPPIPEETAPLNTVFSEPISYTYDSDKFTGRIGTKHINLLTKDKVIVPGLQITDDYNQQGAIWSKEKIDLKQKFVFESYLYLGAQYDESGDGMTFTLHNDERGSQAIGQPGMGLGVYSDFNGQVNKKGSPNHVNNALSLEFDTYHNNGGAYLMDEKVNPQPIERYQERYLDHCGRVRYRWVTGTKEKQYGHIAFVKPNSNNNQPTDQHHQLRVLENDYLSNGNWKKLTITWEPNTTNSGSLSYKLVDLQAIQQDNPDIWEYQETYTIEETYEIQDVLREFNSTEVNWGFTGSTGRYNRNENICGKYEQNILAITKIPQQLDKGNLTIRKKDVEPDPMNIEQDTKQDESVTITSYLRREEQLALQEQSLNRVTLTYQIEKGMTFDPDSLSVLPNFIQYESETSNNQVPHNQLKYDISSVSNDDGKELTKLVFNNCDLSGLDKDGKILGFDAYIEPEEKKEIPYDLLASFTMTQKLEGPPVYQPGYYVDITAEYYKELYEYYKELGKDNWYYKMYAEYFYYIFIQLKEDPYCYQCVSCCGHTKCRKKKTCCSHKKGCCGKDKKSCCGHTTCQDGVSCVTKTKCCKHKECRSKKTCCSHKKCCCDPFCDVNWGYLPGVWVPGEEHTYYYKANLVVAHVKERGGKITLDVPETMGFGQIPIEMRAKDYGIYQFKNGQDVLTEKALTVKDTRSDTLRNQWKLYLTLKQPFQLTDPQNKVVSAKELPDERLFFIDPYMKDTLGGGVDKQTLKRNTPVLLYDASQQTTQDKEYDLTSVIRDAKRLQPQLPLPRADNSTSSSSGNVYERYLFTSETTGLGLTMMPSDFKEEESSNYHYRGTFEFVLSDEP